MAISATVVASFIEGANTCLAVRVAEADGSTVEYIGRVATADLAGLTAAAQKAALVAAAKAVRDAQRPAAPPAPPAISGSVSI